MVKTKRHSLYFLFGGLGLCTVMAHAKAPPPPKAERLSYPTTKTVEQID